MDIAVLVVVVLVPAGGAGPALGAPLGKPVPLLGRPLMDPTGPVPYLGFSKSESIADLPARTYRALSSDASETVKFELYTRKDPGNGTRIFASGAESIRRTAFDPKKATRILIHGFTSHQGPDTGGEVVKNALLSAEDCNVVTVDWHEADTLEYSSAVGVVVPRVGAEVAALVRALQRDLGASLHDVHLIGHSLGAQIAGVAGSKVLGPAGAGRITGLDPAGPLYEGADPSRRLDPSDAAFVQAIHTDGGMLGFVAPTAHVDFYPEGGMHPYPGCGKDIFGLCSHCLVFHLLAYAVEHPRSMVFRSCDSWAAYQRGDCQNATAAIGLDTDPRTRGSFFLSGAVPVPAEHQRIGEKDFVAFVPFAQPLAEDFRC